MEALEDAEAIVYPEYEDALVGHTQGYRIVAVYDYDMCVQILMERDGMSCLEAVEWMEFNTLGSHYGEKTPVFISIS